MTRRLSMLKWFGLILAGFQTESGGRVRVSISMGVIVRVNISVMVRVRVSLSV